MTNENTYYVLRHSDCDRCVWQEKGMYNPICAHCPWSCYSKHRTSSFMTRNMAETLGLVEKERKNDIRKQD